MDLASRYKGVVGFVFGNENSGSSEDSYVERLLDRISNGKLAEDRRSAIVELQSVVAESRGAQLAFGAMGFPVIMGVLKEERDDVEMVRGALETLVGALTPIDHAKGPANEVQPALMNTDLLSRESESISLLLSLLSEEDFYVRYYTLQILTALLTNSQNRLQEAILSIPRGITRLMDMLMDREVIRNEALLLLTYLTREAEEIQKIVVFEGAFEKIFSIIKEEGGSDGGVVVQDCLELLNNILRNNASNQVTAGLIFIVFFFEKKLLDHLLMLGIESQWAPIAVRCSALRSIGDLVAGHPKNLDALSSKVLGEEPQVEPALNSILRIILRTSTMQEFIAADHVFKNFCEKNTDGQAMLASTLIPQPNSMTHAPLEEDVNMSFGSMLLHGLALSESDGDLEFDEMQRSFVFTSVKPSESRKPLTRSNAASMAEIVDVEENDSSDQKNEDHPILSSIFDAQFVNFVKSLEVNIRENIVDVYSRPKSDVAVVPAEMEQKGGESDKDYVKRLKAFVEKQCSEIQKLLGRNATLAEELARTGGSGQSQTDARVSSGSDRVQAETLRRDLQEASQRIEMLKAEKAKIESEALMYQNLAGKLESDLQSLSDAYNSLEQNNLHLEKEVKALKSGGASTPPDIEAIKAEAREEAQKESEAELSDLLVCLGQEQSKVERLSTRLAELGEDVDTLLEGIGDDMGLPEDDEEEEE
ncbi:hypothetical protein COLO4_29171 [Corchorus olitorius]|uniref:Uso1/p115-like vesicle tethering protein C-terminal domain-containing protein n=1 Tax=Corchorus olitorius TaxID=93759 RepID=A0A1R3HFX8_9ROSI|nr:hypothetical protein COLO4_29171 [Corchorus olitorius]